MTDVRVEVSTIKIRDLMSSRLFEFITFIFFLPAKHSSKEGPKNIKMRETNKEAASLPLSILLITFLVNKVVTLFIIVS